jgi:hypothetical protein
MKFALPTVAGLASLADQLKRRSVLAVEKKGQMNRLQKFVELNAHGERSGQTAYAFNASVLPEPTRGLAWRPVAGFNAGDAVLNDPGLKQVFQTAIKQGYALVT